MHLIDGTTSEAQDFHPTTCQDCYRVMYCNVLDNVFASLKDRFNQSSFVVYGNIESLLLKTIMGEDTSNESEYKKRIYNDKINIPQFEIEADVLRVIFYGKKWIALIASCLRLPENNVYFFHARFTCVGSYSPIQALPRQQSDRCPL